jgi:hypothetical protein
VIAIGVGPTVGVSKGNGVELGEGVGGIVGVVVARGKGVSVSLGLGGGMDGDTEGVRVGAGVEVSTRTGALEVDDGSAVAVTSTTVAVGEKRVDTGEQPWINAENPTTARIKTLTIQPSRKVARCLLMRKGVMHQ